MADQGSSQEKTEDATPRRLREARKKGQIPKSRDVSQVFVLIIMFGLFAALITYFGGEFKRYFEICFKEMGKPEITSQALFDLGKLGLITMAKALAPLLVAGMVVALIVGIAQVGALFATDPLIPKPERLNPIEGLKNMFKVATFIELIKNIIKLALIFYLAYSTINKHRDEILYSATINIMHSAKLTGTLIFEFVVKICIAFVIISLFDYVLQRWNFMKNMRMSKDEVKREYKQDEGDPAVKGERRRMHREMAFGDARKAVKKSDVVVTNPIHVACALEYNKKDMSSPQLTVKGQRKYAEMIIEIAREEKIPIIRNIPLAWSLVKLEEGDQIPEELYEAVAEVLTIVYEMKKKSEKKDKEKVYA